MMMGASNLMMGLTLVLVVCLAVVLGLVLVLLAELYCSILLRRRQLQQTTTAAPLTIVDNNNNNSSSPPPSSALPSLSDIYSQGVLAAPRSILYPSLAGDDLEKQQELPQPPENQENNQDGYIRKGCSGNSGRIEKDLVYISNPMFDDENGRRSKAGNTPFETPDTSPSRLESEGSSGDDERDEITSLKVVVTPPITPMKKLPAEVKSVASVKDDDAGRGGDLNSNNGASSSSSSGTPCTSLSW
ncbi:uncharacterized protein LOC111883866 [Lactuca sativa]|uniref:uncharacterized protein LOC111883866 n=1 Tax=Lactuca sativa TaxID=4236 RepID=UPI000CC47DC1|nr:uncharacterized protein LOC111883866 [Lactuca sativa]